MDVTAAGPTLLSLHPWKPRRTRFANNRRKLRTDRRVDCVDAVKDYRVPLADIEIYFTNSVLPNTVARFLREANDRVTQFVRNNAKRESGFVPSNYVSVYNALRAICDADLSSGNSL